MNAYLDSTIEVYYSHLLIKMIFPSFIDVIIDLFYPLIHSLSTLWLLVLEFNCFGYLKTGKSCFID